jgi:hypothetical protein
MLDGKKLLRKLVLACSSANFRYMTDVILDFQLGDGSTGKMCREQWQRVMTKRMKGALDGN